MAEPGKFLKNGSFKLKQMNILQNVLSAMLILTFVVWKWLLFKAMASMKNTRNLFKGS